MSALMRAVKVPGQLDAVAFHGGETGERELDGVDPWPEVRNHVLTGAVGDGRPDLLDECRTGRFHGDARKHSA
jgi:hypothetical protein